MAVPQITIRLAPSTKTEFDGYAARFGLMDSELAKLLIVRERIHKRLAEAHKRGELLQRPRRAGGAGGRLPTVTAHLSSVEDVTAFDAYIRQYNLTRTEAGAWLLEAELRDRWLESALNSR